MTTQNEKAIVQREQLKEMTDEALATLCRSLEQGKSDRLLEYLDTMSRFSKYSFRNLILIVSQKPDATRVMGYQSWKRLGRHVRKYDKAIRIWAPMKVKNAEQAQSDSLANGGEWEETLLFPPGLCFRSEPDWTGKS